MDFHWRCDNKGPTLVLIETVEGGVLGGYTNTSWKSHNGKYANGDKAFLFALSGFELSSPCKMKMKNGTSCYSTYHNRKYGPVFGYGMICVSMHQESCASTSVIHMSKALLVSPPQMLLLATRSRKWKCIKWSTIANIKNIWDPPLTPLQQIDSQRR